MAPSLIKLKQSEADRNTLEDFARNLNRNRKIKQSMDTFLLLVFAKNSQWQHRQTKCACRVKENHTDGFSCTWNANNDNKNPQLH